jgi:predicted nucleotidyltransferase component of viral defense system
MRLPVQHVECFHLILLRVMESHLNRATWVVKGGVNLRVWFGSRRYSEDLDLDAVGSASHVLRERFDGILRGRALADLLASQGLEVVRFSRPKQTETTQRWKLQLKAAAVTVPLHTKVEFSRRGSHDEEYRLEPARSEIVRPYGLPVPTVNHYTARSAVRQKIHALAHRAEVQARDVWDLEHLLRSIAADPRPLPAAVKRTLPAATDRVMALEYDVFKSQVVPYLSPEDRALYGTPDAWDRMRELVIDRLQEFES